jgi:phosphoribosylaminoimidazole-succinocarboxamide synthase
VLPAQLPPPLAETHFTGFGDRYQGKVRDVYRPGDGRLLLVTTDRISAFDHVLRQAIPLKGQVLNQLAAFSFAHTADVCPNHVLAIPDPCVTACIECEALPIEFVVRGYLAGHAWRVYREGGRELCGERLPEGLREGMRLPRPLLTPATKASEGHDEDISRAEIVARGLLDADTLDRVTDFALRLFERGSTLAADQGLHLVDTKYEFGRAPDGRLLVIDEVHTPDSSRYYYAEGYEDRLAAGEPQRQLSKEFVREWLMANGFQGKDHQRLPDLPPSFVREIAARYVELFEAVTGTPFEPVLSSDPEARVEGAIEAYLGRAFSRP